MNRLVLVLACLAAVTSTSLISQNKVNLTYNVSSSQKAGWSEGISDYDGQVFSTIVEHKSLHRPSISIKYYSTLGQVHTFNRFINLKTKSKTISKENIESPSTISKGDLLVLSSGKVYEVVGTTEQNITLNESFDSKKYSSENESSYFICLPVSARDITVKLSE